MKRRLFSVFMAFAMILTLVYAPVEKEFLTVITAEAASIKSSEITARADYMYNLKVPDIATLAPRSKFEILKDRVFKKGGK